DPVVAADVQGDRVGVAAAGRDHVGGGDPVAAGVQLQQVGQLLPGRLAELRRAELGAQLGVLPLQVRDGGLVRGSAGQGAEENADRIVHVTGDPLDRAEDVGADVTDRRGPAAPEVQRD